MLDHASPDRRRIVRAIDAHDAHASFNQFANQVRVVGGFARHRDHDAGLAPERRRSQDRIRMLGEQRWATLEGDRRILNEVVRHRLAEQRVKYAEHGLKRSHHVRFHASQRAESEA